ncbi:protein IQ-DOMAIN 33-like [Arachis duranensis]|uniref:Protein IQ-DOMAIN 33-like n=1 Tax=Arachis duranensis TaxID=130453 RepID=A0A6P5N7H8_ARADU|nr:protein IQ-DOMAIN 33-like [Arachis duranensis]
MPNSSSSTFLSEETAAIWIESTYRSFLLRHLKDEIKCNNGEVQLNLVTESPNRKSMGTSVEVQAANSAKMFSVEGENKAEGITENSEEWDDSIVSSYVSKMRMQNRMEASTRRERALAYAFSQQTSGKTWCGLFVWADGVQDELSERAVSGDDDGDRKMNFAWRMRKMEADIRNLKFITHVLGFGFLVVVIFVGMV